MSNVVDGTDDDALWNYGKGTGNVRANLHFTLWMCIADDSSKVKGVKAVFIRISSKVTSEQSSARLY